MLVEKIEIDKRFNEIKVLVLGKAFIKDNQAITTQFRELSKQKELFMVSVDKILKRLKIAEDARANFRNGHDALVEYTTTSRGITREGQMKAFNISEVAAMVAHSNRLEATIGIREYIDNISISLLRGQQYGIYHILKTPRCWLRP